jgi:O-succinylbenzoic acid--CoA ligase
LIVSPSALVFEDAPENIFFDFIALTPYQLKLTMESSPQRFQQVKKCLVGGSSISNQLLNKIKLLSSECQFFESFGMSETLSHFAIKQLDTQNDFYRVIEGYHIQVSSEGQLSIQCPFLDYTVVSNDIVEMIDAKYFRYLGRKDFIVNSAGIKIHPELLEASLQDSFSFPFYFSKENDDVFGEILVLNILKENELSDIEILELYKLQIKNKFFLPKKINRLQAFEYTQNGKIRKI